MLTGTLKYIQTLEDGSTFEHFMQIRGIDLSESFQGRLETHSLQTIQFIGGNAGMNGLDVRRFNIKLAGVKVETFKYTDENGKSKNFPVNDLFWCRLGALYRYVKDNCYFRNERGYTGLAVASGELVPESEVVYDIPFEDGSGILATVTLRLGNVVNMYLKTNDLELRLDTDDSELETFNDFTVAINKGFRYTEETLGIYIKPQEVDTTNDSTEELYETLEEVMAQHPNRNYAWLFDRKYYIVTDEMLPGLINELMAWEDYIYYDTETTGLNITFKSRVGQGDQCVGIILQVEDGVSFFFPMQMKKVKNLCGGDHKYFMSRYIKPILETKKIVAHNAPFDWKVAFIYDINANIVDDTLTMFKLTLGAERSDLKVGLKELTSMFLKRDALELKDFSKSGTWGGDGLKFWDLPEEWVRLYACADTDDTLGLHKYALKNNLLGRYNAERVYQIEMAFSYAVAYQEFYGHRINIEKVPELTEQVERICSVQQHILWALCGSQFNIGSPKQLISEVQKLGLTLPTDWKTGRPTTNAKKLQKYIYEDKEFVKAYTKPLEEKLFSMYKDGELDENVVAELVQKYKANAFENTNMNIFYYHLNAYRDSNNIRTKFLGKLSEHSTADGFIFTEVNQFGTDTGRVSVKKPNYQSYDDITKRYTIPPDDYYFIDSDYSSIEYRTLGSIVGNQFIIEGFKDPEFDYHQYQASRLFDIPYEAVSKKLRKQSKSLNFGIPYGMGYASLGEQIFGERNDINTEKAKKMKKKYFVGQEDIENAFTVWQNDGVNKGYTETHFCRRRYYDKTKMRIDSIKRQAGNHVIQGTAADIYKLAVGRVFSMICREGWLGKVLICAFVHDEVLIAVHKSIDPAVFLKKFKEEYEVKIDGFCPLYIGFGYGRSWYEAKSVEIPIKLQSEIIEQYGDTGFPDDIWGGDIEKFCDGIPEMIRESNIDSVKKEIQNPESQGKVIKPATMAYLYDINKEDESFLKEVVNDCFQEDYLEVQEMGEQAYISAYYKRIVNELNSRYCIEGILKREDGSWNYEISGTGKLDLQQALDLFCELHNVDRTKVNLLHSSDVETPEVSSSNVGSLDYDEDEISKKELQLMMDTRIKQLGMFTDVENSEVIFEYIPQLAEIVLNRAKKEDVGYRVYFKNYAEDRLLRLDAFITSKDISDLQDTYIKFKSMQSLGLI